MAHSYESDVLLVHSDHVRSSAAVGKCQQAGYKDFNQFLSRFQKVSVAAHLKLKEQMPDLSVQEISMMFREMTERTTEEVYALIDMYGCEGEPIQAYLEQFDHLALRTIEIID